MYYTSALEKLSKLAMAALVAIPAGAIIPDEAQAKGGSSSPVRSSPSSVSALARKPAFTPVISSKPTTTPSSTVMAVPSTQSPGSLSTRPATTPVVLSSEISPRQPSKIVAGLRTTGQVSWEVAKLGGHVISEQIKLQNCWYISNHFNPASRCFILYPRNDATAATRAYLAQEIQPNEFTGWIDNFVLGQCFSANVGKQAATCIKPKDLSALITKLGDEADMLLATPIPANAPFQNILAHKLGYSLEKQEISLR